MTGKILMTYAGVIYKSAFRNKRRTFLTIASIAFSLFLLTTLKTIMTEFDRAESYGSAHLRLVVRRATSLADPLPEYYLEKMKRVPHVRVVSEMTWFGGYYMEKKNFFANFATNPDTFFNMFSELTVTQDELKIFQREKSSCIVGRKTMERFGWKIGDRVTLKGDIFPVDLDFIIRGTYTGLDETNFFFRRDYFEEALNWKGWIGTIWLKADAPENMPLIIDTVDKMFKNTAAETKTETEQQFTLGFINMLGNIRQLITRISLVVIFTILLVCTTTMSMSIREQIREVAVLKTLGFQQHTIYFLLMSEAVAITFLGGFIGTIGARMFYYYFDMAKMTQNFFPIFQVLPTTIMMGLGISILIGVISAAVPAYNAIKMPVTQGLKHIG